LSWSVIIGENIWNTVVLFVLSCWFFSAQKMQIPSNWASIQLGPLPLSVGLPRRLSLRQDFKPTSLGRDGGKVRSCTVPPQPSNLRAGPAPYIACGTGLLCIPGCKSLFSWSWSRVPILFALPLFILILLTSCFAGPSSQPSCRDRSLFESLPTF